ncbi:MAG: DUF6273 domain-containing protein [Succinivibrionaceae bacterium]
MGIIHKDLKPSNMMISDDESHIVLIDFGISSVVTNSTVVVTQTGKSPFYSAPETTTGLFLVESDYYSLWISLYELTTGYTPFQNTSSNINDNEISRYAMIQQIPYPDGFNKNLAKLINGLTYKDITYRNDKNNPNRRWGYEEICKWLKGEELIVPGISPKSPKSIHKNGEEQLLNNALLHGAFIPYKFKNKTYNSLSDLLIALMSNWEDGKKELGRGFLTRHFDNMNDNSRKELCQVTEKLFTTTQESNDQDIAFFKLMYGLDPTIKSICFKGNNYADITYYANKLYILASRFLKSNNRDSKKSKNNELSDAVILFGSDAIIGYVKNNESLKSIIPLIEDIANFLKNNSISVIDKVLYICYKLINKVLVKINDNVFTSQDEISEYFGELQHKDLEAFVEESMNAMDNDTDVIRKVYGNKLADNINEILWNYEKLSKVLNLHRICPKCGSLAPDLANNCLVCGWNLDDKDLSEWYCNKCHSVNRGKDAFCSKCGHPQGIDYHAPITCRSCGRSLPHDAKACDYCLTPIKGNLLIEQIKAHRQLFIIIAIVIGICAISYAVLINKSNSNYWKKNYVSEVNQLRDSLSKSNQKLDEKLKQASELSHKLAEKNKEIKIIQGNLSNIDKKNQDNLLSNQKLIEENSKLNTEKQSLISKIEDQHIELLENEAKIAELQKQLSKIKQEVRNSQRTEVLDTSSEKLNLKDVKIGSIVKFGSYIQDNSYAQPIEWRILDYVDGKALLLTDKLIDAKPFNSSGRSNIWEDSTIRSWLNNEFLNTAFTVEEKNKIVVSNINTDGRVTKDRVFLLSIDEVEKYFQTNYLRKAYITKYAKSHNGYNSGDLGWWWLRSPGNLQDYAASVSIGGGVFGYGNSVLSGIYAVRAALWVNL